MKNQILFLVRLMIVYLLLGSFHQLSAKEESEVNLSKEMGVNKACKPSIQGPPGPTGPQGPRGPSGPTGPTGTANPLTSFMNAYFAKVPPIAPPQMVAIGSSIIFNNHTTSSDGAISFTDGTTTFTFNKAGVYEITFGADPRANGDAAGLVLVRSGVQLPGTSYAQALAPNSTMQEMSTVQTFASGDTLQVTYGAIAGSGAMTLNDTEIGGVTDPPVGAFIVITFLRPAL